MKFKPINKLKICPKELRMYTRDHLDSLPRKELQALAKEHSIKANGSSDSIIANILAVEEGTSSADDSNVVKEEVIADVDVVPEKEAASLEKGSVVYGFVNSVWVQVTIKKVNKKTFRVTLGDNSEITLELDLVVAEKPVDAEAEEVQVAEMELDVHQEPEIESSVDEVVATDDIIVEETEAETETVVPNLGRLSWGMTKAQKLRNEAIAKNIATASASKEPAKRSSSFAQTSLVTTPSKRKLFKAVDRNSFLMETCTPFAAKSRRNSTQEEAAAPAASTSAKNALTPKAPPKSPNFKAIHAKQFQNSKPITAVIKKNAAVDAKMTAALANAKSSNTTVVSTKTAVAVAKTLVPAKTSAPSKPASTSVVFGARPRAPTRTVKRGENVYGTNSFGSGSIEQKTFGVHANVGPVAKAPPTVITPVFKARPMPNFKVVHSKLVTPTGANASANKENSANKRPVTTGAVTAKTAVTSGVPEKARMHRQSLYMSSSKDKRASVASSKRAFAGY